MARNLYALLVGINDYPFFKPLKGCVNDALSMKGYLDGLSGWEQHIEVLLGNKPVDELGAGEGSTEEAKEDDQTPTKARLVDTFLTHLGQAKEDDVALFFFAGHGVQEETNIPAFQKAESGGLLESLVCYDSKPNRENEINNCLADKELRYMISQVSKNGAHVVTIFDCCHSGDNTRDAFGTPRIARENALPSRSWEGFMFNEHVSKMDLEEKPLPEVIPQGAHIQMAACRDVELAIEKKQPHGRRGGNLPSCLLSFLQMAGRDISYYDLKTRLTNFMRGWKGSAQSPQIYVHPPTSRSLYAGFLDGLATEQPVSQIVINNPYKGLILNIGAFHGLENKDIGKEVQLFAKKDSGTPILAHIETIYPDHCILKPSGNQNIRPGEVFHAHLKANVSRPISVFADGDSSEMDLFRSLFTDDDEEKNRYIELTDHENLADYVVRSKNAEFLITYGFDDKPLVEQIGYQNIAGARRAKDYLEQIARWELIRNLHNAHTQLDKGGPSHLPMYPVEIRMTRLEKDNTEDTVTLSKPSINIPLLYPGEDGKPSTKIKLELINHSRRELYVSLVYLPMTFGSYPTLLPGNGMWLEPNTSVRAAEDQFIGLSHDPYIAHYNWPDTREFVKLLISTTEFDTEALYLAELPAPVIPGNEDEFRGSFNIPPVKREVQKDDWMDYTVEFRIMNPAYKVPAELS